METTIKWTETNSRGDGVRYCDQWICDFEAVGYVITLPGVRYCLCETCKRAFILGATAAANGGDVEFYDFDDPGEWKDVEEDEHDDVQ